METKWGGTPWDLDDRDHFFQRALEQTARHDKRLALWHGVAGHGRPTVEPVLVLWGQASRKLADAPVRRHPSGVVVMSGEQLQDWVLRRGRDRLTAEQITAIWAEIHGQVQRRDEHERITQPMPRSLVELARTMLACVVTALVGFLIAAQVLTVFCSPILWCVVGLALAAAAELVRRRAVWPWQARSFQAGVASAYVLGAIAAVSASWLA